MWLTGFAPKSAFQLYVPHFAGYVPDIHAADQRVFSRDGFQGNNHCKDRRSRWWNCKTMAFKNRFEAVLTPHAGLRLLLPVLRPPGNDHGCHVLRCSPDSSMGSSIQLGNSHRRRFPHPVHGSGRLGRCSNPSSGTCTSPVPFLVPRYRLPAW